VSEWKYGPPTECGVYVASIGKDNHARRFWNGSNWSAPWYEGDPPDIVNRVKHTPAEGGGSPIAWARRVNEPSPQQFDRKLCVRGVPAIFDAWLKCRAGASPAKIVPQFARIDRKVYVLLPRLTEIAVANTAEDADLILAALAAYRDAH
jgi:hypothetical protein